MSSPTAAEREFAEAPFRHEALLYQTVGEFLDGTMSFIRDGVAANEPILVVLADVKNDMLRGALGADADRVRFADMATVGANPARIIPAWRKFAHQCSAAGGPFRGIGEPIWAGRSPDELVECQRHESLLNLAFADTRDFRLLCPYDATTLGPAVLEEAHRSHPVIIEGPHERTSTNYRHLDEVAAPFDSPLPEPSHVLAEFPVGAETLGRLRKTVAYHATQAGLSDAETHDFVVAANEIGTNTLVHGSGRGTLRLWRQTGAVVCEVRDAGRITDPLAGRVPPPEGAHGGMGLWLATQLCDLVQVRTLATGSIVRLHMRAH